MIRHVVILTLFAGEYGEAGAAQVVNIRFSLYHYQKKSAFQNLAITLNDNWRTLSVIDSTRYPAHVFKHGLKCGVEYCMGIFITRIFKTNKIKTKVRSNFRDFVCKIHPWAKGILDKGMEIILKK